MPDNVNPQQRIGCIKHLDQAWHKLSRLPDLAGITRFEFDQTIDHMVLHGYLLRTQPLPRCAASCGPVP